MNSLFKEVLFTRWYARLLILLCSLVAAALGLLSPLLQKEFIDHLTGNFERSFFHANFPILYLILGAFFCMLFSLGFAQLTTFLSARESLFMQRIFADRLYNKTLHLKVDTMSSRPVGEIVSLYATDVQGATVFLDQTLPAGASTIFPLILAPFAISLIFDIPLWPTVMVMCGITLINTAMAFRQSKFFYRFKQLAAERIALVNEWIQNIRTIRILGWIHFFEKNIFAKREVETRNRVLMVTNGQLMNAISSSITFILNVVTLGSLIYFTDHQLSSGELLALLWIVGVFLTKPFRQMPWFFTFAFDSWTSLQRLQKFMDVENAENGDSASAQGADNGEAPESWALDVKNLRLTINNRRILRGIDIKVAEGELVGIVGEVGAGKSMLLLSLLQETGASFERYQIGDKNGLDLTSDEIRANFSYVPQEGFIMSASLRENVAFLYDIDPDRDAMVEESLKLAQFDLSTERVENGLDTEIGERGVNLSGGQRQRVGLARVHFHGAPILLLDDCLSAVDVDTEKKLFEQLIMGAWKDRTRVLVTHRLSALNRVDRIYFMKDGEILDVGNFDELLLRSPEFREYTMSIAESATKKEETKHV
jgi:ABC-type multidrug transport system, ATPase and permease components